MRTLRRRGIANAHEVRYRKLSQDTYFFAPKKPRKAIWMGTTYNYVLSEDEFIETIKRYSNRQYGNGENYIDYWN